MLWHEIQAAVGLALCSKFLKEDAGTAARESPSTNSSAAVTRITDFLEGAQLSNKLETLIKDSKTNAAVGLVAQTITGLKAGLFDVAAMPLLGMLGSVLGASMTQDSGAVQRAVGIAAGHVAAGIARCINTTTGVPLFTLPAQIGGQTAGGSQEAAVLDLLTGLDLSDTAQQQLAEAISQKQMEQKPEEKEKDQVLEGGIGEDVFQQEEQYAVVCAWLVLLLNTSTSSLGQTPSALWDLTSHVAKSVYYLTARAGGKEENDIALAAHTAHRVEVLVKGLLALVDMQSTQNAQRMSQVLMQSRQPWLSVAAAWLSDAAAIRTLLSTQQPSSTGTKVSLAETLQSFYGSSRSPAGQALAAQTPTLDDCSAAWAVEETLQLLEEASRQTSIQTDHAAVPLWYAFFSRYHRYAAMLQPLVNKEELIMQLAGLTQKYYGSAFGTELSATLSALSNVVNASAGTAASAVESLQLTIIGDSNVARTIGKIDESWVQWAGGAAAAAASRAGAAGRGGAQLPGLPPLDGVTFERLDALHAEQKQSMESSAAVLRSWARR